MAKVVHKYIEGYVFEVYGAMEYVEHHREHGKEWLETISKLLIFEGGEWTWVSSINYIPYEEDNND